MLQCYTDDSWCLLISRRRVQVAIWFPKDLPHHPSFSRIQSKVASNTWLRLLQISPQNQQSRRGTVDAEKCMFLPSIKVKALLLHTPQAKLLAVGSVLTWPNKGWLIRASIIEHSHCCSINLITSPINPQLQPVTAAELIDMPARFPVRIRQTVLAFPAQALGLCPCHQHSYHCWLPAMQLHGEISCSSSTFGEKEWDEGLQSCPSCIDLKWKEVG